MELSLLVIVVRISWLSSLGPPDRTHGSALVSVMVLIDIMQGLDDTNLKNKSQTLSNVLRFKSYQREFIFRDATAFVTHERWETNAEQKHVQHRMKEKRWLSRTRPACFFPSLSHASRLFCSFRRERLDEAAFSCFLFFVNKVNKAHEWTERKSARIKTQ